MIDSYNRSEDMFSEDMFSLKRGAMFVGRKKELNTINEKLQDALSLLIILENDFQLQHTDEVYQRTIHIIHEILKSALND